MKGHFKVKIIFHNIILLYVRLIKSVKLNKLIKKNSVSVFKKIIFRLQTNNSICIQTVDGFLKPKHVPNIYIT